MYALILYTYLHSKPVYSNGKWFYIVIMNEQLHACSHATAKYSHVAA